MPDGNHAMRYRKIYSTKLPHKNASSCFKIFNKNSTIANVKSNHRNAILCNINIPKVAIEIIFANMQNIFIQFLKRKAPKFLHMCKYPTAACKFRIVEKNLT